ncbi:MAG: ATP-binding protein [Azovibrio sp.]
MDPPHQSAVHTTAEPAIILIRLVAVLSVMLGGSILAGWMFGFPVLKSVLPGAVEMKANTALGFVLSGCALYILGARPSPALQHLAHALSLIVCALGIATLSQYLFGWQLGIDELLFQDTAHTYSSRMSPYSALAFASIGFTLTVLQRPPWRPLVWLMASIVIAIGAISFLSYVWNAHKLITDLWLPPVAIHAAIGFILLGLGILLASHSGHRNAMTQFLTRLPVEVKIFAGFIGSIVVLFVAGGFTYHTGAEFTRSARWVAHTQEVRTALGQLYASISDAESAQRNYLLTGNREFEQEYRRTLPKLNNQERALVRLVADNPVQLQHLSELRPFIVQRINALERYIKIFERQNMAAVQRAITSGTGIVAKDEIRRMVGRMDNTERQLLVDREAALKYERVLMFVTLVAMITVAMGILMVLYIGIRRQIAARTEVEQALVIAKEAADAANQAKSTFLATMSHEIRTPMSGVLGTLELLGMTKLKPGQRNTLNIAHESAKSLLRIINSILDFSQIEAGKLEIRPEAIVLREVMETVRNIYAGNASNKGLSIRLDIDANISTVVWGDPLRLRQILNNFVSNAIKFTSEGTIEIKAELIERVDGEDKVRFSVKDTGIGISKENQQRLFQPFNQAESSTTRRYGGTGLGLTICRRLADMMGGSIEMQSTLGKGTTMILTLSLPVVDAKDWPENNPETRQDQLGQLSAAQGTYRVAPSIAEARQEETLVLLVDDHPTNRLLLRHQLHTLGYAAECAKNGVEALVMWKSRRFSLLITDCNMPEMDGYDLVRTIRKLESGNGGKRIPIIAFTANALSNEVEKCFAAGMDDYLIKPVELTQLLKKLDHWLPIPQNESIAVVPIVDHSALTTISGGNAEAEREILSLFRRVNDEDAAMLKQAVADIDILKVGDAAHRIKGASMMIGAMGLAKACEHIERASRDNDWSVIETGMDAFNEEWMRLNAYFDSH